MIRRRTSVSRIDGIHRKLLAAQIAPAFDFRSDIYRQGDSLRYLGDGHNLRTLAARPPEHVIERRRNDRPRFLAETAHLIRGIRRDEQLHIDSFLSEEPSPTGDI